MQISSIHTNHISVIRTHTTYLSCMCVSLTLGTCMTENSAHTAMLCHTRSLSHYCLSRMYTLFSVMHVSVIHTRTASTYEMRVSESQPARERESALVSERKQEREHKRNETEWKRERSEKRAREWEKRNVYVCFCMCGRLYIRYSRVLIDWVSVECCC